MKKFICALLSLAMLALFSGCRDQKNIETDTTDASSGSVEAQVEDPSAASPDSTVPQTDSESASIEETKADASSNGTTAVPAKQPSVSVGKFAFIRIKGRHSAIRFRKQDMGGSRRRCIHTAQKHL